MTKWIHLEPLFQTLEDNFREEKLSVGELEQMLVAADASLMKSMPLVRSELGRLENACRVAG